MYIVILVQCLSRSERWPAPSSFQSLLLLKMRPSVVATLTSTQLWPLTGIMPIQQQLSLESNQDKPDKKGKGKAPKTANLLARIDEEIPLIDRMEDIDNYNERVFIALESDKTNKVVQMDIDEDAVSLGDDDTYEDARQFYADHNFVGDENYTKYGNGLLNKKLANTSHIVKTVEIILLRVKRRQAYVTKYNLDACLIIIGHRLDTDELYKICHPNMYMKHGL